MASARCYNCAPVSALFLEDQDFWSLVRILDQRSEQPPGQIGHSETTLRTGQSRGSQGQLGRSRAGSCWGVMTPQQQRRDAH